MTSWIDPSPDWPEVKNPNPKSSIDKFTALFFTASAEVVADHG